MGEACSCKIVLHGKYHFINYMGGGGAYLISGPKKGGLMERGMGAYSKSYISDEIHNNFPKFLLHQ